MLVCGQRAVGVVPARCEWSPIITEVKLSFLRQCINIKSICIEIVCQIIGGKQIDGRRVARFNSNFQQALDYFKWCKASHRISVGCHVSSAFLIFMSTVQFFVSPCSS